MKFPQGLIEQYRRPVNWKSLKIRFIPSTSFEVAGRELEGFNEALPRPYGTKTVLSNKEEYELFLKFNYAKYRASLISKRESIKIWLAKAAYYKDILAYHNLRLVYKIIRRSELGRPDEVAGEALLALNRAIDKFDVDRGVKFSTFTSRVIYTALTTNLRNTRKHKHASLETKEGDDIYLDEHDGEEVAVARMDVERMVYNNLELTDRDRLILSKLYDLNGQGSKTTKAAAEELGISTQALHQQKSRIFAMIRGRFAQFTGDESKMRRIRKKNREQREKARADSVKRARAMKEAERDLQPV